MKRIVGVDYENGMCVGITVDGILDNNTNPNELVNFERIRHGHWIDAYPDIEPNPMFMYGICSVCGFEQSIANKLKYCPNCGAKMDEKENEK